MTNRKSDKKKNKKITNLKEIDGIRFRMMWSTRISYFFLGLMVFVVIMVQIISLLEYKSIASNFDELIPLLVVVIPVLLFLNYINRKFLGVIVAVINENGIYAKNKFISWKKIKKIGYTTPIPLSRTRNKYELYCYLTVFTDNHEYKILHAPHKMIKYIKKYVPDVHVKRDNELILTILVCLGGAVLIPIMHKFELFD